MTDEASAASLRPIDLVALALYFKPDADTTAAKMSDVLVQRGLTHWGRAKLEEALALGISECPALSRAGERAVLTHPSWILSATIRAVAYANRLQPERARNEPATAKPPETPGSERTTPASHARRIQPPKQRAPGKPVLAGRPVTYEFRGRTATIGNAPKKREQSSRKPGASQTRSRTKERTGAASSALSGAKRAETKDTNGSPDRTPRLLREPAEASLPELSLTSSGITELAQMLEGTRCTLPDAILALQADLVGSAQAFSELWSLSTLTGIESHAYQVETVRRVLRTFRGRALLADEVGLGKTIEAMMLLREYQLRGMARRTLILVPPSLVDHWRGELAEKAGIVARTTQKDAHRRDQGFWTDDGTVIASLALARSSTYADKVVEPSWDLVIADEAHHLKNNRTLSWQLVNRLKSRFLLLLTATPVETDLTELYNLVTLIKPGQFATPAAFRSKFVDPKNPTSPKNRDRLRALLSEVMVRNTRAQSGLKLPPRYVSTITVEPTSEEQALYASVVELLRQHGSAPGTRLAASTLLLEAGSAPASLIDTLRRLVNNERHSAEFREQAGKLLPSAEAVTATKKDQAVLDILRHADAGALIFTRFVRTAEHVARQLTQAGLVVDLYHGGLSADQKRAALDRFRQGASTLVATDVGGEGQNLQFCHVLVNYDLPYNPMQIEQRIGRLHRMGQTEPVRVFNLCSRGTAEERLLDLLHQRLNLFELVVGEVDMVLGNLADERDLEERILSLYAQSTSDEELSRGFDQIEQELSQARQRYEKTRELDEALFRRDFEA